MKVFIVALVAYWWFFYLFLSIYMNSVSFNLSLTVIETMVLANNPPTFGYNKTRGLRS